MSNLVSQFASQGTYSNPPTVFVTAKHHRKGLKHDAASVWLEDVSAASFKICLRELQNFAGVHEEIPVVISSAFFALYGGQFTLSTQLLTLNYLLTRPQTQHHSFFRNLSPLFI